MNETSYPVLSEQRLDRVRPRFLLFARRELAELPQQEPGTVLVFEVNGRFAVYEDRRHLSGREETVVDAVAVSLVDVRERLVPVRLRLPSRRASDEFEVVAMFRCRVTDAQAVIRSGLLDITVPLCEHLRRDSRLKHLATQYPVDDINEARDALSAQLQAYCTLHPPRLAGMDVTLSTVDVATPTALVDQAKRLRDEEWRHMYERLRRSFEEEDAHRLTDLLRGGPEGIEALAISRGDITAGQAADRAYAGQDEKQRRLLEILGVLQKDGHLDRLRVDADVLVDAFTDSIAPRRADRQLPERPERSQPRSVTGRNTGDQSEDFVLDEDELDNDELDQ